MQAVRCTLGRYGAGNHFENCARFVEDMGKKCAAAWAKIDAARQAASALQPTHQIRLGLALVESTLLLWPARLLLCDVGAGCMHT